MEPAVAVMLTGAFPVCSTGDFEDPRLWRGFKSSEKPGPQAEASPEASPQPAESLAAAGGQS